MRTDMALSVVRIRYLATLCLAVAALQLLALFLVQAADAGVVNFLKPVDMSSPRASLESFLGNADRSLKAFGRDGYRSEETLEYNKRAAEVLDLSEVPPSLREDVAFETVLLLEEVFRRIPLPDLASVPDHQAMLKAKRTSWRVPGTDIEFTLMEEGPFKGEYLISAETVAEAESFYRYVKELPLLSGEGVVGYEEYIYSSGWMIPASFIASLPDWALRGVYEQAVWQWCGLFFSVAATALLLFLLYRVTRFAKAKTRDSVAYLWVRLLFPVCSMLVVYGLDRFIDDQINITGKVLAITLMALEGVIVAFAIWSILVLGNFAIWVLHHAPGVRPKGIDADLMRLVIRIATLAAIFLLIYNAADFFGIPVTAVFASAGIAGVAVALAARETLANFFGGISIFLDRPFRAGDYIVLDKGERGEVTEVGLRSTRVRTRDDVMITIPNSVITNVKVINESAPVPHYRVRIAIGVAYGSDIDQVQSVLMDLARKSELVAPHPEPRVRFRTFGDFSLNFELLCWAKRPHDRGRLVHQLNCAIYKTFAQLNIEIPYPHHEVLLHDKRG